MTLIKELGLKINVVCVRDGSWCPARADRGDSRRAEQNCELADAATRSVAKGHARKKEKPFGK
jgi:hypothetical protein